MSMKNMTGEELRLAIDDTKRTLDQQALRKNIALRVATDHFVMQKLAMIDAAKALYAHLHGNAPKPKMSASAAFNPQESDNRTCLHYVFKALYQGMPWEIQRGYLVTPFSMAFTMLELLDELFPSTHLMDARFAYQRLVNLVTLPVERPDLSDDERTRQRAHYFHEMEICEEEIKRAYSELSKYFLALEEPRKDPDHGKFEKIYVNTENLAKEFCKREKPASLIVQDRALAIWEQNKNSPELKAKCCRKHHRVGYADVYDHCKRELNELGIMSAISFEKAVVAAKKRNLRLSNGTKSIKRDK